MGAYQVRHFFLETSLNIYAIQNYKINCDKDVCGAQIGRRSRRRWFVGDNSSLELTIETPAGSVCLINTSVPRLSFRDSRKEFDSTHETIGLEEVARQATEKNAG